MVCARIDIDKVELESWESQNCISSNALGFKHSTEFNSKAIGNNSRKNLSEEAYTNRDFACRHFDILLNSA